MSEVVMRGDVLLPIAAAFVLTALAEAVYVVVWGMVLFPEGDLAGKLLWAATCGIAMAAVIGGATAFLTTPDSRSGFWISAAVMAAVGIYCTLVCGLLDARLGYFGGPANRQLFLWSGIVPSIAGRLVFGWILFGSGARALRLMLGGTR